MPRREQFDLGDILHIYNRGVDKRTTFEDAYDYARYVDLLRFCRLYDYPFSSYKGRLKQTQDDEICEQVETSMEHFHAYTDPLCSVVAFTLMPNHYHLILQETQEGGVAKFLSKVINAYTKYFNIKNERTGNLFSGAYKHAWVDSEEQLIHLSRYVHINPTAAGLVRVFDLKDYPWSSFPEYLKDNKEEGTEYCDAKDLVLSQFKSRRSYFNFVTAEFREDEAAFRLDGLTLDDDFGWYDAAI